MLVIIPSTENNEHIPTLHASYSYLTGKLEAIAGYDIFGVLDDGQLVPQRSDKWLKGALTTGIYDCVCMGYPCTFFYWSDDYDNPRGLVVANYDTDTMDWALIKYNERQSSL